jgi:hypothetical protein
VGARGGHTSRVAVLTEARRAQRLAAVDNLKTGMVAWIIAGHALLGYTAIGGWPYDEVNEETLSRRSELGLSLVLGPTALFVVGTFFFLSGLLAPRTVERKGPARYARDRLLRLGLPWLSAVLLVWPLSMWLAYRAAGHDVSYWWTFTHRTPLLDSGPLWFAEVLMIFSLAYAARVRAGGARPDPPEARLGLRRLVTVTVAIALASFVVRLWFPAMSKQILDLHLWWWPACFGMFALGVAAGRRDWLSHVPGRLYRACGLAVVGIVVAAPGLFAVLDVSDLAAASPAYLGGWHWQALLLAGLEAGLVVAGSVWLLGLAQRRLNRGGRLSAACGRGAFAAFALQGPVLLGLASAARPLPVPPEIKALLVGAVSVVLCLSLGWLLATRTRLGRIV